MLNCNYIKTSKVNGDTKDSPEMLCVFKCRESLGLVGMDPFVNGK